MSLNLGAARPREESAVETLRTERLVLRMLREDDLDQYAAMTADAEGE